MAVTIYNHSRTPYQYEVERDNLRWPIPFGENTYPIQDGLRVFQQGQKKSICAWPLGPGVVGSDVVTAADMVHQSPTYITITPRGVVPHIPSWGITQYDPMQPPSYITEPKPNIEKVITEKTPACTTRARTPPSPGPPAYDDIFPTN